jgi:hypothetical protein
VAVLALLTLPRGPSPLEAAAVGAVAGFVLMVKADAGVVATGIGVASLVALPLVGQRRVLLALRSAAAFGVGLAVVGLAGWLAAGQRLGDLGVWAHGVLSMAAGYTSAMAITGDGLRLVPAVLGLVVVAVSLVAVVVGSGFDRSRQLAAGVVGLGALYLAFRQGFVRFDAEHVRQTYAVAIALLLAVAATRAMTRKAVATGLAVVAVAYLPGQLTDLRKFVDPVGRVSGAVDSVRLVVIPGDRQDYLAATRSKLNRTFRVPDAMVERIGTGTVQVVPWSLLVLWSHPGLRWEPLPVFQDYAVHTTYLDERNAARLREDDGPAFVLRERNKSIDSKLFQFEPPLENVELACRYRLVQSSTRWQLLERGPNQCGAIGRAASTAARFGSPVPVPPADDAIVVGRFTGVRDSLLDRLRTTVFRGPATYIGSGSKWYRFVVGHQSSWHVLRLPDCARTATGPDLIDFPFVTMSDRSDRPSGDGAYTVELARVPYRCPPPADAPG